MDVLNVSLKYKYLSIHVYYLGIEHMFSIMQVVEDY